MEHKIAAGNEIGLDNHNNAPDQRVENQDLS